MYSRTSAKEKSVSILYLLRQRILRTTTSPKIQASCPLFLFFLGIPLQTVRKAQNTLTFKLKISVILNP